VSNNTIYIVETGSYLSSLDFTNLHYLEFGHFNLFANYKNGTVVGGPNSAQIFVEKNEATPSQRHNFFSTTSGSISSASSIETTTSNGATTSITISETPIPSSQSMSPSGDLNGDAIAGIVVDVIVAVVIVGIYGLFYQRKRIGERTSHKKTSTKRVRGSQEEAHRSN
jgi:hypothetical protein